MAARGAIQTFWHHFRQLSDSVYFSWAELQARGAVHYHGMIVNPPWRLEREARYWIQHHWPMADIQPNIQRRSAHWFRKAGGNYVKAYAKKRPAAGASTSTSSTAAAPIDRSVRTQTVGIGAGAARVSKAYQQEYDELPREIRTFQHSKCTWQLHQVDAHLPRPDVVNTAPPFAPWPVRILHYWILGDLVDRPPRGGCTLKTKKRRRSFPNSRRRFKKGTGGKSTRPLQRM